MTQPNITLHELEQSWPQFSHDIQQFLQELQLDTLGLACDHVAVRVNSVAGADLLKDYFGHRGRIISNNMINGRPILIIALNRPLQLAHMLIDCVELPYPSDKHYPNEGWEHIEVVLPGEAQNIEQLSQQLLNALPTLAPVLAGKTDIKVKCSSPQGEHERLANPTIAFKRANLCIKVHAHGIKTIIASEAK
ncbi:VOC family protein [Shewanella algidipiscicola]|uniref:VOC family protein n=1 Tax=Shewanella algidipiscicola TaxID=614070 RepID=A0ABQ4PL53_9GAMM|nr:VOC family protein [Shewanella algidipiscicola]GIU48001.1 VOC family protein [Shewanella algidipiscicola]